MIRISSLKLHIDHTPEDLIRAIAGKLRISDTGLLDYKIVKQSLDAREKEDIHFVYTVDVSVSDEASVLRKNKNRNNIWKKSNRKKYY